jgi:hypothetical protein
MATSGLKEVANRPLPPASDSPSAADFMWQPTVDFQVQIHNGFTDNMVLRDDGQPTWNENSGVAQISGRCAKRLQDGVRGIGRLELRRMYRAGGAAAVGAALSTYAAFTSPTPETARQMFGISVPATIAATYDATDYQIFMLLSGGHAQCVKDRVDKSKEELGRVTIVMVPMLHFKAEQPTAPGVPEPTPDELDERSGR